MDYQNLLIKNKGRICLITINRESKLNALNAATLAELHQAFTYAFADKETGGIIITGAGSKAFVAGADISELSQLNALTAREMVTAAHKSVFDFIANGNKPVIAAINGYALGGGLELAMAAHIRIAAATAKMGLPETTLGLIPGYGGTQRLTALVSKGKALELILTADAISANEALKIGLVNQIADGAGLLHTAEEMMHKILQRGPLALTAAIRSVNAAQGMSGFETEIKEFTSLFDTEDTKEGLAAFLQKRKPAFKGE